MLIVQGTCNILYYKYCGLHTMVILHLNYYLNLHILIIDLLCACKYTAT